MFQINFSNFKNILKKTFQKIFSKNSFQENCSRKLFKKKRFRKISQKIIKNIV